MGLIVLLTPLISGNGSLWASFNNLDAGNLSSRTTSHVEWITVQCPTLCCFGCIPYPTIPELFGYLSHSTDNDEACVV